MKFLTIILLSIFLIPSSFGQVMEAKKPMSKGEQNALVITLPKADTKVACKQFEKFMKNYKAKVRSIKKSDEMFADDAELPTLSSNTVDVYFVATAQGEDTQLSAWFDLGGAYLNSADYPDKYNSAKVLMNEYSEQVYQIYIAEMLDMEEDTLKDMEGDLKDVNKDQKNSEENIEKYLEKIEEEKKAIEEAKNKRVQIQSDIEAQKKKVGKVKSKMNK